MRLEILIFYGVLLQNFRHAHGGNLPVGVDGGLDFVTGFFLLACVGTLNILRGREVYGLFILFVADFFLADFIVVVDAPVHVCNIIFVDFIHERDDIGFRSILLSKEVTHKRCDATFEA